MILAKSFIDAVMNPVRQRIAQHLIINGRATVAELSQAMPDVPRPSIYRHIKVLAEAGLIRVAEEKRVRGAVERTYALVEKPLGEVSGGDIAALFAGTLTAVMGSFAAYFKKPGRDPARDMLSVSTSTLMLSDAEFTEFLTRIGGIYNDYIGNGPGGGRKARCVTIVSSPAGEKKNA